MKTESEFVVTDARGTFEMGQRPAVERSAKNRFTGFTRIIIVSTTLVLRGNPHRSLALPPSPPPPSAVPFTRSVASPEVLRRSTSFFLHSERFFFVRKYHITICDQPVAMFHCLKSFSIFEGEEFVRLLMCVHDLQWRNVNEKRRKKEKKKREMKDIENRNEKTKRTSSIDWKVHFVCLKTRKRTKRNQTPAMSSAESRPVVKPTN